MDLRKIFVAVVLVDVKPKKIVAIPGKWIEGLNLTRVLNRGSQPQAEKTIFYSNDISRTPNFQLPQRAVFDKHVDACYKAMIKRGYKTLEETYKYIKDKYPHLTIDYLDTAAEDHVFSHATKIDDLVFFHDTAHLEFPAAMHELMNFDVKDELQQEPVEEEEDGLIHQ